jgi:hypothetical protein
MYIREYYYNDDNRMLYIEFSIDNDREETYRVLELTLEDVMYYSPNIIHENDMYKMEEDDVIELIDQYSTENELPEESIL